MTGKRAGADLSLRHPAALLATLVAALAVLISVSFRILDTDFWQHLLVGKAIWQLHAVPHQHLWSWPSYGAEEVLPSWGFRALIWPFWHLGGITGLFVWRWATTLAAFGLAWATARRLGARGLSPLLVIALCALVYRQRSQVRPETLASVLIALEIWILERRRSVRPRPGPVAGAAEAPPAGARARDLSWGLIAVAWAWANAHISYFLGFVLIGIHLVEDRLERRDPRRLAWILLACVGVSLLNPFGWRALWQPFDYFLRLRHEPLFRGIGELQPVSWSAGRSDGTFVLLLGWPVLLLWRARRFGPDRVEVMLCAFLTAYALPAQRFLGTYAVVAAPYAARDLDAWVRSRRWPVWSANAWVRACLASAAIVGAGLPEWSDRDRPLGIGIDWKRFPVAACDFMGAHAVAGRGFGETRVAGYQLWCFWPDRTRLPFMDIHQTGTPADRALYAAVFSRRSGWAEMVRRHTFDYILLDRYQYPGDSLADVLDADSTWSLVFLDDAAALYVRRGGPLRAVADSFGYRLLGAGPERTTALAAAWGADSALRAGCRTELEREAAGSALDAAAERGLGMLALADRRTADARRHLERALDVDPATPRTHEALGTVELWDGQPGQALLEFERERAVSGWYPGLELRMGMACQAAGDRAGARRHFERELARYPDDARARALIEGLESAP